MFHFCPHFWLIRPHKIKAFKDKICYTLMFIFAPAENGFKMRTFLMVRSVAAVSGFCISSQNKAIDYAADTS